MENTHQPLIVVGSVREGRSGPAVADRAAERARGHGRPTRWARAPRTARESVPYQA